MLLNLKKNNFTLIFKIKMLIISILMIMEKIGLRKIEKIKELRDIWLILKKMKRRYKSKLILLMKIKSNI